jgi:hypothetical protein
VESLRVVERLRCFFANLGSKIREFHDLQTHRNRSRDFTGNLLSISGMGSDGDDVRVMIVLSSTIVTTQYSLAPTATIRENQKREKTK